MPRREDPLENLQRALEGRPRRLVLAQGAGIKGISDGDSDQGESPTFLEAALQARYHARSPIEHVQGDRT